MNSPPAPAFADIDLSELEQRLRLTGGAGAYAEDPMAELARLVGMKGPPAPSGAKVVALAEARNARAHVAEPAAAAAVEAALAAEISQPPVLRPSFEDAAPAVDADTKYDDSETESAFAAPAQQAPAEPRRGARWYATVGLMAGVGLIALATGLGAKYGLPGLPKKPPLILAAEGPAKVLPPNQEAAAASQNADSILAKDAKGAKAPPAKIVVNEEQPVDLHLAPPAPAQPPVAAQPAAPLALEPVAVATPAKPAQENLAPAPTTPVVAPAAISPTPAAPVTQLAAPLPVHVVSVRPDGTVIGAEGAATPAAALAPPPVVAAPVGPVSAPAQDAAVTPQATTPKLDFKAKPSAKSTARVATAKIDTTVPATDAPLQIGLPTKLEKAAKAAKAKAGAPSPAPAAETTAAPTQAAPATPNVLASLANALSQAPAAPAAPTPTPAPAAATDGGGVFAVQLAAPGSEEEAQGDIKRLKAKYASELGGLEPGVHKADVNGRAVYRVRVTGMSKTGAVALCEKLRASGGACFLAKG